MLLDEDEITYRGSSVSMEGDEGASERKRCKHHRKELAPK